MFNLETAIGEWKERMLSAGIKTPAPMDELETHLREEIERQVKSGMDGEAAFKGALEKIGAAKALNGEFAKLEKEMRAAREAKFVMLFSLATMVVFAVMVAAMLFYRIGYLSELNSGQQMSGYVALALMLFFSFGGRFGYKMFPKIERKKIRDAIVVSACVLLVCWAQILFWLILPRNDYRLDQLVLVLMWGFVMPFGLTVGLSSGLEMAARKSVSANS